MFNFIKRPRGFGAWAFVILLALHSLWVLNHLRLHAERSINPWKGGGYGMYTIPAPNQDWIVHSSASAEMRPSAANRKKRASTGFLLEHHVLANKNRWRRCAHLSHSSMAGFVQANRKILEPYIIVRAVESVFDPSTRKHPRKQIGRVKLEVRDGYIYYVSRMCGEEKSGRTPLKSLKELEG